MGVKTCRPLQVPDILPQELVVEGPVSAEQFDQLQMNTKLTNFRPSDRQKEALKIISQMPEGMIYAARYGNEIVGYVTFHLTDKYCRWSRHPRALELGGIEISPDHRQKGIGAALLKKSFENPVMEDYIVITIEFCWHWDLKRSGLEIFSYQRMLAKLFGTAGLVRRDTDDPDILEHPANVLMVRVGKNVAKDDIYLFETMLYEGKGMFYRRL